VHHCTIHTTYPPASDEQPLAPVYMVFQLIMCTAPDVTTRTGELLPHLFTLARRSFSEGWASLSSADGSFLLHFNTLADIFPLGSMMLCADRTFLPFKRKGDGTTCCPAKVVKPGQMIKLLVTFAPRLLCLAVLRSCGLAVLRSCGLAVLRSCGLAVLRSCGRAIY
jgi:hypothetical protein